MWQLLCSTLLISTVVNNHILQNLSNLVAIALLMMQHPYEEWDFNSYFHEGEGLILLVGWLSMSFFCFAFCVLFIFLIE